VGVSCHNDGLNHNIISTCPLKDKVIMAVKLVVQLLVEMEMLVDDTFLKKIPTWIL